MSISLITAPVAEPISLSDAKLQLGFGPMQDSDRAASQILNDLLRAFIVSARQACENYTRSVYITQRWLLQLDSFPGVDPRYDEDGNPCIVLPKPPFQSLDWFKYVDTSGTVQTLLRDTTYGVGAAQYGYQVNNGSETQPTQLGHPWARPWPPARRVSQAVNIQFRCGFGGPLTVSMTSGSALLTVANGITFNPDDAPLMVGDTGLPLSIPGAGAAGATLNTFIASVDGSGNATLATAAATSVAGVTAWAGDPIPAVITAAIKLTVQEFYNKGSDAEGVPPVAIALLDPYRNLVA